MDIKQDQITEKQHITTITGVCGGKPCIAGTRIRVWDIHVWHDLRGMTPAEIVADSPQLSVADVYAALTHYHDHREQIERQAMEDEEVVAKLQTGQGPTRYTQLRDEVLKDKDLRDKDGGSNPIPSR